MSLALLGKIVEDEEITDSKEYNVLLALADATNKETMLCYPSLARITKVARCTRPTAIEALRRLEKKGWIQVIRRIRKDGAHLANTYRVIKYGDLGSQATLPPIVKPFDHPLVKPRDYVVKNDPKGSKATLPQPVIQPVIEPPKPTAPAPPRAKRAKLAADVGLVQLPLFLQGDDFRKALQDWVDHRIMLRIPMTQRGLEEVVKTCEQWDKATAIKNIHLSIESGWKKVYAPRKEPRPPKDPSDAF